MSWINLQWSFEGWYSSATEPPQAEGAIRHSDLLPNQNNPFHYFPFLPSNSVSHQISPVPTPKLGLLGWVCGNWSTCEQYFNNKSAWVRKTSFSLHHPRDHYVGLLPLSIQLEVFSIFFSATWISHFGMPEFVITIETAIISKWPNRCSLRGTFSRWGCLEAGWHHSTLSWASEIQLYPDLEIYHKRHQ